jgi:hypothetical protein
MHLDTEVSRQKTLQIKSRGREVSIEPGLSPELVDFLVACDRYNINLLVNVSGIKRAGACGTDRV